MRDRETPDRKILVSRIYSPVVQSVRAVRCSMNRADTGRLLQGRLRAVALPAPWSNPSRDKRATMKRALFKASKHDMQRLSAEELFIYFEIVNLLTAEGMTQMEAEDAAYLSFFIK